MLLPWEIDVINGRSPSWGAWIEMLMYTGAPSSLSGRSPSWGAWIEMPCLSLYTLPEFCRSPSWGAWIEIVSLSRHMRLLTVAPPRGERGLKYAPDL